MKNRILKILLLEDSRIDAEIIQRMLLKEINNCAFSLAMNKTDFLNALDEFAPDVILSDNSLLQFNASEALKIVRQRSLHTPFILITGTVSEEYAATIIKQGADDYILKDRMVRLPASIETALRYRQVEKEKQEAAEQLKHSEENYRTIMERVSDAFVAIDKNWCYTYVNKQAGEIMNREPGSLIGRYIWKEFPDAIGLPIYNAYHKAMDTQRYLHIEEHYAPFDVWLENHIYPSPEGLSIFFRNITKRKIAEREKEFDRNNLSALINNTADLMWSVDKDFKLITFNEAFNRVIEFTSGKPLEKGYDILASQFTEEQRERYKIFYERALSGETFTIIDHFDLPLEFWSEISFYPIRQGDEVIGTACFSRDITERKKLEEERKHLQAALYEEQLTRTATAIEAQEKERNAIGIELHDNVNQILVGTKLLLSLAKSQPDQALGLLTSSIENLQSAIDENRKIAHELVAPSFEEKSISDQVIRLADNMLTHSGIDVRIDDSAFDEELLSDQQKLAVYRIAQEQCTNIVKYAKAQVVNITLSTSAGVLRMAIADDGVGMEAGKEINGIGISNIRGRLSIFNGTANIITAPGKGFMLEVSMPVTESFAE